MSRRDPRSIRQLNKTQRLNNTCSIRCTNYKSYLLAEKKKTCRRRVNFLVESNVELGKYSDEKLFKCCLSVVANPLSRSDLINRPILVVGSVLMESEQLGSVGWGCTEPVI